MNRFKNKKFGYKKERGYEVKGKVGEDGYEYIDLMCSDKQFRKYRRDRVVWYAFNGEIPEDCELEHIDGDKLNCALNNLRLVKIENK